MSAEVLRRAASLMRERAEAAGADLPDVPWVAGPMLDADNEGWYVASDIPEADWDTTVVRLPYDYEGSTAAHVASWHPAVALAVADWLDAVAGVWQGTFSSNVIGGAIMARQHHALIVARVYLGEPS